MKGLLIAFFLAIGISRPLNCPGYRVKSKSSIGCNTQILLELRGASPQECRAFGSDYPELLVTIQEESDERIKVRIGDVEGKRWTVPDNVLSRPNYECAERDYEIAVSEESFGFSVKRSDGSVIFNTMPFSLVFKEQYMELTSELPKNANIYGLGETVSTFRRKLNSTTAIWARDIPTPVDENDYGSHPMYIEIRDAKAHGVLLVNSNGMDVVLDEASLSYRVIGGVLEFYFMLGPSPEHVVKQLSEIIGKPAMMPAWSLGWHQCRWGYKSVHEVKSVVRKYREHGLPLEAMWIDIDYMDGYRVFTYDPVKFSVQGMRDLKKELSDNNQKLVLIVDPGVKIDHGYPVYESGMKRNVYIGLPRANNKLFTGKVWPGYTYFPDWMKNQTQAWWIEEIAKWYEMVSLDGLWIDMNEIANFCDSGDCFYSKSSPVDYSNYAGIGLFAHEFNPHDPPYKIDNGGKGQRLPLQFRTSPMDATHGNKEDVLDYFVHNIYGHLESKLTYKALSQLKPNERPFILTRSSFTGTGKYAAHWLGDNWSTWESMRYSIPGVLSMTSVFGIPMVGADICGFLDNTEEELCTRWTQMGALLYPFMRNHNWNEGKPQEPYLFPSVKEAMVEYVYGIRYEFLPYIYSLMFRASEYGETHTIRPLAWEFYSDENTLNIDKQALVGAGILVTPVMEKGARSVEGYLPKGTWYDLKSNELIYHRDKGKTVLFDAPLNVIPLHLRGGKILPHFVKPLTGLSTREVWANGRIGFTIPVDVSALSESELPIQDATLAEGHLYLDHEAGLFTDKELGTEMNIKLNIKEGRVIKFQCETGLCWSKVYPLRLIIDAKKFGDWSSVPAFSKNSTLDFIKVLGLLEAITELENRDIDLKPLEFQDNQDILPEQPPQLTIDGHEAVQIVAGNGKPFLMIIWDPNTGVALNGDSFELVLSVLGSIHPLK